MSGEDQKLLSDSKYKQFTSGVDKCLKNFEYSSEWADLISCLGKLNKIIQTYSQFPVVPRKLLIGKRLAQCLHPALPSGVHLKALESYDLILKQIGPTRLAQDLFIYSAGLFPVLSQASIAVRPVLLDLYEKHFLPLKKKLYPGLSGLLVALLPGIEEGSEYTERTTSLLTNLSNDISEDLFFTCLWDTVLHSSPTRLSAMTFVIGYMAKKPGDLRGMILGRDVNLMVNAVCASLDDSNVLVQRITLDFTLSFITFHTSVLTYRHLVKILTYALGVLLRRDMSLNRRIFQWFLNVNSDGTQIVKIERKPNKTEKRQITTEDKEVTTKGRKHVTRENEKSNSGDEKTEGKNTKSKLKIENKDDKSKSVDGKDNEQSRNKTKNKQTTGNKTDSADVVDFADDAGDAYDIQNNLSEDEMNEENGKNDEDVVNHVTGSQGNANIENGEHYQSGEIDGNEETSVRGDAKNVEHMAGVIENSADNKNNMNSEIGCTENDINGTNININGIPVVDYEDSSAASTARYDRDDLDGEASYFDQYVREPLTVAMVILFQNVLETIKTSATHVNNIFSAASVSRHRQTHLKPFRILITLLDKPEVGSAILEDLMLEIFRTIYKHSQVKTKLLGMSNEGRNIASVHGEVIKNANLLFNSLEPYFIWDYLSKVLRQCGPQPRQVGEKSLTYGMATSYAISSLIDIKAPTYLEVFNLVSYLLDVVTVETSMETQSEHWPNLLKNIIQEMITNMGHLDLLTLFEGISLISKLFSRLEPAFPISNVGEHQYNQDQNPSVASSALSANDATNDDLSPPDSPLLNKEADAFDSSPDTSTDETTNYVRRCIELSKILFTKFVSNIVLKNDKGLLLIMKERATEQGGGSTGRIDFGDLQTYNDNFYQRDRTTSDVDPGKENMNDNTNSKFPSETVVQTFQIFCEYLVRISCFPMPEESLSSRTIDNSNAQNIPQWLQSLLCCCCYGYCFDIQTAAMSTLLDLINVTLTVISSNERAVEGSGVGGSRVVPLVTARNLAWIQRSNLFKFLAKSLWRRLTPAHCQNHRKAVELFLQLHNITPSSNICEDVISSALVNMNLAEKEKSHWRFSCLWHLSRDFYKDDNNKANKGTRTIDKCMFLMIDSLQSDHPKVREYAKLWLEHAVNFGDIGRILETILLILLHPSTSRIAIHYAPLFNTRKKDVQLSTPTPMKKHAPVICVTTCSGKEQESSGKEHSEDEGTDPGKHSTDYSTIERSESQLSAFADDEGDDDDEGTRVEVSSLSGSAKGEPIKIVPTHPLLIHKLMYTQSYDTQQCLYALKHILMLLKVEGRAFICSAATTSMNVCNTPHQSLLRELLIRHRKVLSGKEFYGSLADAHQLLIRASTAKYLEIMLSVSLYFIRSDFHQNVNVTSADIEGNFTVQETSAEILTRVASLLLDIARDSGSGFSAYVSDLLTRSKIQRISLHCLLSTVYAVTGDFRDSNETGFYSMVECPNLTTTTPRRETGRSTLDLQCSLLNLIESLIFLESCIGTESVATAPPEKKSKSRDKNITINKAAPFSYVSFKPIVSQPMFISAILTVLREKKWMYLHNNWIKLLISCLPKFNEHMSKIIVPVIYQLCDNLKTVTKIYKNSYNGNNNKKDTCVIEMPPDYMLVLLNGITSFCHYCLISTTTGGSLSSTAGRMSSKHKVGGDESTSLFSNLVQAFSTTSSTPSKTTTSEEDSPALIETRDGLLGILPAILTAVTSVWKVWDTTKQHSHSLASNTPLGIGEPKAVRLSILQLITPIAMNHTVIFLSSIADVWNSYRETSYMKPSHVLRCKEWLQLTNKKYIPPLTADQTVLLEIVQAIKALTTQSILEMSKQVLRNLTSEKDKDKTFSVSVEVHMLHFLYELLIKTTDDEMEQVKVDMLSLLKDALTLNMSPPPTFLLFAILNIYVQRVQIPEERRARRELQDLVQKFLENLNSTAASSLEGSAWFRRSLQVVTQMDQSSDLEESTHSDKSSVPETHVQPNSTNTKIAQYSVPAILVLAEYLPAMLDLVYLSEEKDKIASLLVYLVYNVIPYLKNHSNQNIAGYRACSALLAGISDYQYTLRAWRKDVYELFLESDFFQMDLLSFRFWRVIVDRLITYDNTVFKDLMQKIVLSQSGAINIFANREQEMEQRAQLLKRLSFIIFCGEHDQYHQYLPDIQERLAESIRQLQGPFLHEQVFLCFRLLLVRMSSNHLISLWPPILTELVLIFVHMEHELSNSGKQKAKTKTAVFESFLGVNGYFKDPNKWLRLYLAVCKLLDFLLILPSDLLPHYQVYKWAFSETPGIYCANGIEEIEEDYETNAPTKNSSKNKEDINDHKNRIRKDNITKSRDEMSKMALLNAPISEQKRMASKEKQKSRSKENNRHKNVASVFLPHITRIIKILQQKNLGEDSWHTPLRVPGELILLQRKIQSIYDLLPFFITATGELAKQDVEVSKFSRFRQEHVEDLIEKDFIEHASALT